MCHRCYQVKTDSPPCSLCMPAREQNIQAWILTFIARGLPSLQLIRHRVKRSPSPTRFSLIFLAEPSGGALQGPQARPQAQSHGGPEEQAATSRRSLVRGEGEGPRQRSRSGTRSGTEQDVLVRGGSPCTHGYKHGGGNKYVNRRREEKKTLSYFGSPFCSISSPSPPVLFSPLPSSSSISSLFSPSLCSAVLHSEITSPVHLILHHLALLFPLCFCALKPQQSKPTLPSLSPNIPLCPGSLSLYFLIDGGLWSSGILGCLCVSFFYLLCLLISSVWPPVHSPLLSQIYLR